jgi:glutaredoxin
MRCGATDMNKVSGRSLAALLLLVLGASAAQQWWAGTAERRLGERLAALAQPGDIRMLSSETCPYCESARRTMTAHGVRFEECFVERDAQCRALYDATLARGTPTLIVRGQAQVGFDLERVVGAFEARKG